MWIVCGVRSLLVCYCEGVVRVVRDDAISCCRFSIQPEGQIISHIDRNVEELMLLLILNFCIFVSIKHLLCMYPMYFN